MTILHVYPCAEAREHVLKGLAKHCECEVRVEDVYTNRRGFTEHVGKIVVHQAFDPALREPVDSEPFKNLLM